MRYTHEEKILTDRFQVLFEAQYPDIPVDYLGQKTNPVNGVLVKFRIRRAVSQQVATRNTDGIALQRTLGSVLIVVSSPTGQGPGAILAIVEYISDIFKRFRQDGVVCRTASLTGPAEVGTFLEATVDVPFTSHYHD